MFPLAGLAVPLIVLWAIHAGLLSWPMNDPDLVINLSRVSEQSPLRYFYTDFGHGYFPCYRPVAKLAVWVDWELFGYNAWGYYLGGLVHASVFVVLVCLAAWRFSGSLAAASAAGTYAALTTQTSQTFIWPVLSHMEPISGSLVLLAMLCFLRFQEKGRWWLLAGAGLAAWGALATKEPGVAVLPALVLLAWFRRRVCPLRYGLALVAVVALTYAAARWYALSGAVAEYMAEDRAYFTQELTNNVLGEMPLAARVKLYLYMFVANVLGMPVPALFSGGGRLRAEFLHPRKIGSHWLLDVTLLVSQLLVLGMALAAVRRRNWRVYLLTGAVLAGVAAGSFVIYRWRNHCIGVGMYAVLVATALATLRSERRPWTRAARGLLWAGLVVLCAAFVISDVRYLREARASLAERDIARYPFPYPVSQEILREIRRRYPPTDPGGDKDRN